MRWIPPLWDCKFTRRPRHHCAEPCAVNTYNRCALNPASIWNLCFTVQMLVSPAVTSIQKDVALTCPDNTSCPYLNPTSGQELRPFLSPRPWFLWIENPSKQARKGWQSNVARPHSGENARPHCGAHPLLSLASPGPLAGLARSWLTHLSYIWGFSSLQILCLLLGCSERGVDSAIWT